MQTVDIPISAALLLDSIGFDRGACGITAMVGACIPKEVLPICRAAIEAESQKPSTNTDGKKCLCGSCKAVCIHNDK